MDAKRIIDLLNEMQQLMELKGENVFKVRAFAKAAGIIEELGDAEDWTARAKEGSLTEIAGIGKGISQVLTEFLLEAKTTARDELAASLPEGLMEFTKVPGLGPKKAMKIIEDLKIHTLGELEYACLENRLLHLKGFGQKVQQRVLDGVLFLKQTSGQQRLSDALPVAAHLLPELVRAANDGKGKLRVAETGALRRQLEIISELEFLIEKEGEDQSLVEARLRAAVAGVAAKVGKTALPVKFYFAAKKNWGSVLAATTATEDHRQALLGSADYPICETEEAVYESLHAPWIPPEMRETGEEIGIARKKGLADILPWDGIRGVFHNHTTRSDGVATVEEMVVAAKTRGYQYIGISDHSKSAVYAQGLREENLREQAAEIAEVQARHPEIRIFWGIESDILADGSLDYDAATLARFDFVVASVHSRFQMDRETMTLRILEAVRNPATTMLGHLTGRLLLGRKGYELDVERVIAECAKRNVAIEINSHPARLDIDWRWGKCLREAGCFVSINPDAHEEAGLDDTRYGIAVARKALLPSSLVVNSRSTAEVERWLKR